MSETFAVASDKGETSTTTVTLARGIALAKAGRDETVVDADTEMTTLLFHPGLDNADIALHDLLVDGRAATVTDATYGRFGMRVVPEKA
jgi:septum site-determining protein MinD